MEGIKRATPLDRHTNGQDQRNVICHESDTAASYRPYFDNFLISWVAYIHIRAGFDLDWQAAYAASWIMRYMLSIVIIVITMTRTFPSGTQLVFCSS